MFEPVKPAWPLKMRITETFELSDGGTRHSISYEVSPTGPVGRVVAPRVCKLMERSRKTSQLRLQEALAGPERGTP